MIIGQRTRWIDKGKKDGLIQIDQENTLRSGEKLPFDNSLKGAVTCDSDLHTVPECVRPDKLATISN
eukprot:5609258-Prorocentrum_lima.AAC.1